MAMMRAHAAIPRWHAWIAHFFTWIALAGFGLSSGTFDNNESNFGDTANAVSGKISGSFGDASNLVLFVISFGSCGIGVAGMMYYYWVWRRNYPWLLQRIFIPGFSNGLAGAITTISSVFGAQNGHFTVGSYAALGASGALCVICGFFAGVYGLYLIPRLKTDHQKHIAARRTSSASVNSTAKRPVSVTTRTASTTKAVSEKGTATGAKGAKKDANAHRRMRGGWFNRAARLEGKAEGLDHEAHDFMDEGAHLESEADDLMDNPLDVLDMV
ncbi:hypothetical protein EVG20_g11435 [Dentipellis fragilis]|uniref:Uncharacterized protein n=1 Tax=Dentipellis fragilis TaxID=205917 RepID=A0A4Y9XML8_9AGAM|nr:hypothetical protein EVG20_g11435 [Dentipellis fragilis]